MDPRLRRLSIKKNPDQPEARGFRGCTPDLTMHERARPRRLEFVRYTSGQESPSRERPSATGSQESRPPGGWGVPIPRRYPSWTNGRVGYIRVAPRTIRQRTSANAEATAETKRATRGLLREKLVVAGLATFVLFTLMAGEDNLAIFVTPQREQWSESTAAAGAW